MNSITRHRFIQAAAGAGAAIWLPAFARAAGAMGPGGGTGGGGIGGGGMASPSSTRRSARR